jgi:hypothetical protein
VLTNKMERSMRIRDLLCRAEGSNATRRVTNL